MRVGPLYIPLTVRQLLFYVLVFVLLSLFLYTDYKVFYTVLTFVLCGFYGAVIVFRLVSVKWSLVRAFAGRPCEHRIPAEELEKLDPRDLPVYTILVPMYKEPEVAQKIARAVTELDYPLEKLDVKLLLEEDDPETRKKIEEVMDQLPSCVEVIVCPKVPKGQPKTKPRACNWGLERARGQYLVIYDAEDRPEPDQLKKAVAAFRRLKAAGKEKVVCLQAKLNYFNARQNPLTRFFTLEYTTWFDLFLPGLHAFRIPIPLGGTSNHFDTKTLKDLGGWDPFNVTEDCDLGIRMARQGYRTEILDSTTWEEANCRVGNWIRQRSRWIKGYFQTHLVHTRTSWLPSFILCACFLQVARLVAGRMSPDGFLTPEKLAIGRITYGACVLGAVCSGLLGLWALIGRFRKPGPGARHEGRLGLYDALAFRLTVGGMSAMLVLNAAFWVLSGTYLFRKPIADALPAFTDKYRIDGETPREILRSWTLYHTNVKDDRYKDYTIWKTTYQSVVTRQISGETAREIFQNIDEWSFWSQILYPIVIGLFLANFVFVALGLVSCGKRSLWDLAPYAVLMPCSWILISV
ncbi:MAG: glycosyltransferase, partial [Planctomycetota bacterium]|nr:glycosyltransferase [Planctomycetota bacterium]